MMYKLWSGFTKNLRYLLTQKGHAVVRVPKFGTLSRCAGDNDYSGGQLQWSFRGSDELMDHLGCLDDLDDGGADVRNSLSLTGPDWTKIAAVAEI